MKRLWAVTGVVVLTIVACSGDDGSADPPPLLDVVREQLAGANSVPGEQLDAQSDDQPPDLIESVPFQAELPLPDASQFVGRNRVVNLWVGPDGTNQAIDVWGRRTFTSGPVLLAEDVSFGEETDYFGAPPEYSLVMVGAGAGPDGAELGGLLNAQVGEQVTTIFTNDETGAVFTPNLWESDRDGPIAVPEEPPRGQSVVWMYSANTDAFDESLTDSVGGSSFYVGGAVSGVCRPQRAEQQGFQANILGGTQQVELVVGPGPSTLTLHPFSSPDECDQPAAAEIATNAEAGGTLLIVVYTRDGEQIDSITLPVVRE